MKNRTAFFRIGSLCVLAMFLTVAAKISQAQTADSKEISSLLSDAKTHAVRAASDATEMDSFTRSNISWQSYAAKIGVIKEHVNELGKLHADLAAVRHTGSPWQQNAIDQIEPLLQEMADNLSATINHLNENQAKVHMPEFKNYVHANHDLATDLANLIKDFVTYDEARATAADLEQKLK